MEIFDFDIWNKQSQFGSKRYEFDHGDMIEKEIQVNEIVREINVKIFFLNRLYFKFKFTEI